MMENRKGNGIFLGIVSIATLIVAIIGATFAFFSATTQSEENAVNLQAYEYSLSMDVQQVGTFASGLIPMDPDGAVLDGEGHQIAGDNNTNLLYALNEAGKENPARRCVDSNNLQVCAIYAVTITNSAANPVTLVGQIKTTANNPGVGENKTPFANLTYQEVDGTPDDGFTLGTVTAPLKQEVATGEGDTGIAKIDSITVPGAKDGEDGTITTYLVIFLDDNGEDQSSQMGASFAGQLVYTSEGEGGQSLTGTFVVSGTPAEPGGE